MYQMSVDILRVFEALSQGYNAEELRTLCFMLRPDFPQLSYENLPGEGREAKARELIEYFMRRNSIPQLVTKVLEQRPDLRHAIVSDTPASVRKVQRLLASVELASTHIADYSGRIGLGTYENSLSAEHELESALHLAEELHINPYLKKLVHQSIDTVSDEQPLELLNNVPLNKITSSEDWLYLTLAKALIRFRRKRIISGMTMSAAALLEFDMAIKLTKELLDLEPYDPNLMHDLSKLEYEKVRAEERRVESRIARAKELAAYGNTEQAISLLTEAIELPSSDALRLLATQHLEELTGK